MSKQTTATTLTAQERAVKKAKIKELTAKIHQLLTDDPRYRDSDALLVNRIQRDEIIAQGLDVDTMKLTDFFRIRFDKKISSEDSITRLRREVQEYYPETRGDKYKKRQSKQADVQDDLHDVENEIVKSKLEQQHQHNHQHPKTAIAPTTVPMITEPCDMCQGTGKYEAFDCTMCGGTGEVAFNS